MEPQKKSMEKVFIFISKFSTNKNKAKNPLKCLLSMQINHNSLSNCEKNNRITQKYGNSVLLLSNMTIACEVISCKVIFFRKNVEYRRKL
jgi:hypothetical protein